MPKEGVFCALGGECVGSEIAQVKIRRSPCPGVPGFTWYKEVAPGHTEAPEFRSACDLGPKRIRKEVARRVRVRNNTGKVKNIYTVSDNCSFTTSHAGQRSPKQQCRPGNVSFDSHPKAGPVSAGATKSTSVSILLSRLCQGSRPQPVWR